MILSVKLSEDAIVVVLGNAGKRVVIEDCRTYILPRGTLINDVVTDEKQLKVVLEEIKNHYWNYKNKVHLSLGSNQIITKIMQVPPMPKRQLLNLVEKELKHYKGEGTDLIYDYSVICQKNSDNKGGTILGAAIEREKINGYKKLFEECGMRIRTIDVAMNALAKLIENLPALEGKTYILSVVDGRNMLSVLYMDGIYVHTGRNRFLSDRETPEFLEEMQKEIGALIHFGKSLKKGEEIQAIYFGGLSAYEREYLEIEGRYLEEPEHFKIASGIDYHLKEYIYATGNLFGK